MQNLKLLLLLCGGCILFVSGLFVPLHYTTIRYGLMIAGTMLVLLFYFITFFRVIKTSSLSSQRRIFWLVAIICLPVIGNIVYVVFSEMITQRQKPGGIW
jgi:hypothetical protein